MLSGNLNAHDMFIEAMGSPGDLVVIAGINDNGYYRVLDAKGNPSVFTYTDTMFDKNMIDMLLEERLLH